MIEDKELLNEPEKEVEPVTNQPDVRLGTGISNDLAKVAIGGIVGAVVGTVAAALADKRATASINRTVKGAVDAVKGVAEGFNGRVKDAGDALKSVGEDAKSPVQSTMDALEDTKPSGAQDVEIFDTQLLKLYEERLVADKKQVKTGEVAIGKHIETQTAHLSVPVAKERLIIERTPIDAVASEAFGEVAFQQGELVRMEIYEEVADVHKQAFVREQVSVRKEVEHNTLEIEDQIRREELDLDIQDISKTDTL